MACRTYRWPAERREEVLAALRASTTRADAAQRLGVTTAALSHACQIFNLPPSEHLIPDRTPVFASTPSASEPDQAEALKARVAELEEQLAASFVPQEEQGDATPTRAQTIALLGDLHVPEHDRPCWNAVLGWLREHQPDEVILSEFAEWQSASQHGGNWGARWQEDVAAVRRALVQLRSVVPEARITWQETNHDTRLTRLLEQVLPSFAGAMTIPKELGLDALGVEWVPERVVIRRGRLKVIHGHQLASNDRSGLLPKYSAARAVQLYGEPGCTVVYFHTHKTQSWSEPCDGGDKRALNLGCLRTLRPSWLRAREAGWLHQFGVAYVDAGGAANVYPVDIHGGAFTWAGKRYSA